MVVLAVVGNLVSRAIPRVPASAPELRVRWNPVPESLAILRLARRQPAVRNAILGVSWFWFVGTVLTAQLPTYAELHLGAPERSTSLYIFALALFSVGVGVGSLLCEKLSARTVEIGLVPLGAFGISVFLLDLYFARSGAPPVAGVTVGAFLAGDGGWRIAFDLTAIGFPRTVHRAAVRAHPEPDAAGGAVAVIAGSTSRIPPSSSPRPCSASSPTRVGPERAAVSWRWRWPTCCGGVDLQPGAGIPDAVLSWVLVRGCTGPPARASSATCPTRARR